MTSTGLWDWGLLVSLAVLGPFKSGAKSVA
jgi:hypothetical protein